MHIKQSPQGKNTQKAVETIPSYMKCLDKYLFQVNSSLADLAYRCTGGSELAYFLRPPEHTCTWQGQHILKAEESASGHPRVETVCSDPLIIWFYLHSSSSLLIIIWLSMQIFLLGENKLTCKQEYSGPTGSQSAQKLINQHSLGNLMCMSTPQSLKNFTD